VVEDAFLPVQWGFALLEHCSVLFPALLAVGACADGMKPDLVIASSTYPMDIFPARFLGVGGMSPNHPFIRLVQ
jgi:hypothetical protein